MDRKPRIIATVINDVVYDQRMIRICTSLSSKYDVILLGRQKNSTAIKQQPFAQKRLKFLINKGPAFYILYNVRLLFYLLYKRFDIIHAVDLDTLPAAFLAAKLKGKNVVYDAHEYFTHVPELINRPRVQKIWQKLEKILVPRLSYAMTVGAEIAKQYANDYGVFFEVIRNCPVYSPIELPQKQGSYLVYQGALNKGRGLEEVIKAMQWIDMPLKIAGTGDLDDVLKQLVKTLNLQHKVEFLGLLEPHLLPELSRNAFAGINVSENLGLSYYYSLNNKYFDYIHAGIPAITNPFPEYLTLNKAYDCCVFSNSNATEIADAFKLLINDIELYARLSKNCLFARQHFTWANEELKLMKLYESIPH